MSLLKRIEAADRRATERVAQWRDHPAVRTLGSISELADQPQLIAICVGTTVAAAAVGDRKLVRCGAAMLAAELIATRIKSFVKHRVDRTRPHVAVNGGRYKLRPGDSEESAFNSFPSGHTAGAVAVAGVVATAYPRYRAPALVAAAAVAAIQVPRTKHYPADLVAGAAIGAVASALANLLIRHEISASPDAR